MTRLRNCRGETIVEVLFGIAILSLVLSIGYATASQSLRAMQDARERTEATHHAASLVEAIRVYSTLQAARHADPHAGNTNLVIARLFPPYPASGTYCIETRGHAIRDRQPPVPAPSSPNPDPTQDPAACRRGEDRRYFATVRVTALDPDDHDGPPRHEYTVRVTWEGLFGADVHNVVEMKYRTARVVN